MLQNFRWAQSGHRPGPRAPAHTRSDLTCTVHTNLAQAFSCGKVTHPLIARVFFTQEHCNRTDSSWLLLQIYGARICWDQSQGQEVEDPYLISPPNFPCTCLDPIQFLYSSAGQSFHTSSIVKPGGRRKVRYTLEISARALPVAIGLWQFSSVPPTCLPCRPDLWAEPALCSDAVGRLPCLCLTPRGHSRSAVPSQSTPLESTHRRPTLSLPRSASSPLSPVQPRPPPARPNQRRMPNSTSIAGLSSPRSRWTSRRSWLLEAVACLSARPVNSITRVRGSRASLYLPNGCIPADSELAM